MIEMEIGGLGFDPRTMSPIVLLRDKEERNFLPIWIGMFEAAAIAMEIQKFSPPRPMTHDLIKELIDKLGIQVSRIVINDIRNSTFYALIELTKKADKKSAAAAIAVPPAPASGASTAAPASGPASVGPVDSLPGMPASPVAKTYAPSAAAAVPSAPTGPAGISGLAALKPGETIGLDCRPSDAIALAVRSKAPIYVTENVMMQAKMVNAEKDAEETKKFKEFVQNLNPEDFTKYYGSHG